MARADVKGEVVCADLFSPPEAMLESFDVVVSFCLAEHFEDTKSWIKALAKFLKPKGVIITIIPNMIGLVGWIQKIVNKPIFDMHILLDSDILAEAYTDAGLKIIHSTYFISTHFGVCNNLQGIPPKSFEWLSKKIILLFLIFLSLLVWLCESKLFPFRPNRLTSPYINCVAWKP